MSMKTARFYAAQINLQENADDAARSLIDDFRQCFLNLHADIVGHAHELSRKLLSDKFA